jgi:3-oxoacyl-[acyl-carrier protein] reductase
MLAGQVAVITGPAKGMGGAITRALAKAGADCVLVGRDVAAMEALLPDLAALGRHATIIQGDVTSVADMDRMAEAAARAFGGRIDILVNVAGVRGPIDKAAWEIDPEEFDEVIGVNLRGTFLPIRAVLPAMVKRRSGKIVNIGGTFGMRGRAKRAAYSASKWGLRGLTRSLALDAGPHNINVNCVCPGVVLGDRFERSTADRMRLTGKPREELLADLASEIALRRFVTDEDIANAVLFLVSEAARNITGQELVVDGGFVV